MCLSKISFYFTSSYQRTFIRNLLGTYDVPCKKILPLTFTTIQSTCGYRSYTMIQICMRLPLHKKTLLHEDKFTQKVIFAQRVIFAQSKKKSKNKTFIKKVIKKNQPTVKVRDNSHKSEKK